MSPFFVLFHRIFARMGVGIFMLLFLVACHPVEPVEQVVLPVPKRDFKQMVQQELHLPLAQFPPLDPYCIENPAHWLPIYQVMEGLFRLGREGEIEGGLAYTWEASSDYTVWTFMLRRANWSDGTPIRAEDFITTWQKMVDSDDKTLYHWTLQERIIQVEATEAGALQIVTKRPERELIQWLSTLPFYPTPPAYDRERPLAITNGPFRVGAFTSSQLRLEKNRQYWDADHVQLEALVFHLLPEQEEQLRRFAQGEIHLVGLKQRPTSLAYAEQWIQVPVPILHYVQLNPHFPPLEQAEIRAGIHQALERGDFTIAFPGLQTEPLTHWLQPFSFQMRGQSGEEMSLIVEVEGAAEKRLTEEALTEAAFADQFSSPLPLLVQTGRESWEEAQIMRGQLTRFGIPVQLKLLGQNQWKEEKQHGEYGIVMGELIPLLHDPLHLLESLFQLSGRKLSPQEEKEYQQRLERARSAETELKREEYLQQLECFLREELSLYPIYMEYHGMLVSPSLRNLHVQEFTGLFDGKHIWLE